MKLIKDIFILFIFSAVIALCNYALNSHRPNTELLPDELTFEMLDKLPPPIMFIDARSEEEFSSGHLENAYNISESQFDAHFSTIGSRNLFLLYIAILEPAILAEILLTD